MRPFILKEPGEWFKMKLYVAYSDVWFVGNGSLSRSKFADILTSTGVCNVVGWSCVSLLTNTSDWARSSYVVYDIIFISDDIHNIDKVLDEVDSIIKKSHK